MILCLLLVVRLYLWHFQTKPVHHEFVVLGNLKVFHIH